MIKKILYNFQTERRRKKQKVKVAIVYNQSLIK